MKMEVTINQVSPETSGGNQGWLLVNVKLLVGLLGMGMCVAWMVIMLTTGVARGMTPADEFAVMVAHLAFVGGLLFALLLAVVIPNVIGAHRAVFLTLWAALALASIVGSSSGLIAGDWMWIPYLVNGISCGGLYTLYGEFLSNYFSDGIENYVVSVFLLAALVFVFLFFVAAAYGAVYELVLIVCAFVGYILEMAFYKVHKLPFVPRKESVGRSKIVWRSYLATATGGMVLGFSMGCVMVTQRADALLYLGLGVASAIMCAVLLYDGVHEHVLNESFSMRWFLPVAAVLAFPMLFVNEFGACLLAIVMLAAALLPETCSISALCRHIELCNLSAIWQFGVGRSWSVAGMAVGLLLAFGGLSQYAQDLVGPYSLVAAVCIFILFVIASASFVMTEDNYPTLERIMVTEDEEGATSVTVGKGTPIRKLAAPEAEGSGDDADSGKRVGIFQLKCDAVAEQYGLSRRQREVLELLARGRNADYITEKLVISPHTAKAHTYNIYLKLDVHSRQELMDLVENTVVSDEALKAARQQ